MNPQPKQKTPRSPMYLAFIRKQKCCNCGIELKSVAHHIKTGGKGVKCSDYLTLPLCYDKCHIDVHNIGKKTFWGETNLEDLAEKYRRLYDNQRKRHGG